MTKQASLLNAEASKGDVPKSDVQQENMVEEPVQKGAGQTVGQILRAAREAQGMDVGLLASSLKVSVRQLELLELDQYDGLPDMAFTRNFAISVARRLKVDEKLVTDLLPKMDNLAMTGSVVKLTHDARGAVMKDEVLAGKKRSGFWWLLLIGLVVVLAGLFFMLPEWRSDQPDEGGRATRNIGGGVSVPVQVAPMRMQQISNGAQRVESVPPAMAVPVAPEQGEQAGHEAGAVQTPESGEMPSAEPVQEGSSAQDSVQEDGAATGQRGEPVAVAPITNNKLEITTKTESWLKVTAASGKTLYESILKGDAIYSLLLIPEELPLSVRLGRATDAIVTVRGTVFNLSSYIVGDVASFKVE